MFREMKNQKETASERPLFQVPIHIFSDQSQDITKVNY